MIIKILNLFYLIVFLNDLVTSNQLRQDLLSQSLEEVNKNCSFNDHTLNLGFVKLDKNIDLNPVLISDNAFTIVLNENNIEELNKYKVEKVFKLNSDFNSAYESYRVFLKWDTVKFNSNYKVNGSIANIFKLTGKGLIYLQYYNLRFAFDWYIKTKNSSSNNLSDLQKISSEELDFENVTISTKDYLSDTGYPQPSSDDVYHIGKVLLWRTVPKLIKQLSPSINHCLIQNLISKLKFEAFF